MWWRILATIIHLLYLDLTIKTACRKKKLPDRLDKSRGLLNNDRMTKDVTRERKHSDSVLANTFQKKFRIKLDSDVGKQTESRKTDTVKKSTWQK